VLRLHAGAFDQVRIISCDVGEMILFLIIDRAVIPIMIHIVSAGIAIKLIEVQFMFVAVSRLGAHVGIVVIRIATSASSSALSGFLASIGVSFRPAFAPCCWCPHLLLRDVDVCGWLLRWKLKRWLLRHEIHRLWRRCH
jgi:hypothetical protein